MEMMTMLWRIIPLLPLCDYWMLYWLCQDYIFYPTILWSMNISLFWLHRGVVEYDAVGFTKLTLLLMWKDFCFLVHGEIHKYVPFTCTLLCNPDSMETTSLQNLKYVAPGTFPGLLNSPVLWKNMPSVLSKWNLKVQFQSEMSNK